MAITVIMLVGFLVLEIAVIGLVISYLAGENGLGQRSLTQAYEVARSGVNDAVVRIMRDPTGFQAVTSYTITIGSGSASVTVLTVGTKKEIESIGTVLSKHVKLIATTTVDAFSGLVSIESVSQVPLSQ